MLNEKTCRIIYFVVLTIFNNSSAKEFDTFIFSGTKEKKATLSKNEDNNNA